MELLTMISLICGILVFVGSFIGFVFKVMIISPLKVSIDNLSITIAAILKDIEAGRADRYNMSIKLSGMESDIKHIGQRIDALEEYSRR